MIRLEHLTEIWNDERGGALIEYGVIAAMFAVLSMAGLSMLQSNAGSSLSRTGNGLSTYEYQP